MWSSLLFLLLSSCWVVSISLWPCGLQVCWGMFPLCPLCWEVFFFYQKYWNLSKKPFLHLLRWSYGFHSLICWCGVSHWFICPYRNFLHPWDKSHLIMVCDPFNILLNLVCWYFVEDFCIYVISDIGPKFSFLWYFFWFWYQGNADFVERVQKGSFLFNLFGKAWEE